MIFFETKNTGLNQIQRMVNSINRQLHHIAAFVLGSDYQYYVEFDVVTPFNRIGQNLPGFKLRVIREEGLSHNARNFCEGEWMDRRKVKQIVCEYAFALNTKQNRGRTKYVSHNSFIETFDTITKEGMFQLGNIGDLGRPEISTFKRRGWAEFLTLLKHYVGTKLGLEMRETYTHPAMVAIFNKHHRDEADQLIEIVRDIRPDSNNPWVEVIIPPTMAMQTYTVNAIRAWLNNLRMYTRAARPDIAYDIPGDDEVEIPPPERMAYTSHPNPYQVSLDTQK